MHSISSSYIENYCIIANGEKKDPSCSNIRLSEMDVVKRNGTE